MAVSDKIIQRPMPGAHILSFRGDTLTFSLELPGAEKGNARLRTNLGNGAVTQKEIIREVTHEETNLNRDWFDIPMKRVDDKTFQVTVGLSQVGHFEAKCLFLQAKGMDPLWPEGDNTVINVEPAHTCCANIIYNAFVRQFGPNKAGKREPSPAVKETIQKLDGEGYAVIPPSGTFRDLKNELDFIIGDLGCRFIQLLPVHPTPTTFAKMGRFGSPYAALSFVDVDPALAEFDPKATPTEQFIELVDAIHARNAQVLLDIAINHTGWAASLHNSHPDWLVRDQDGRIEAPGAWGVVWEDLTKLDYSHKALWQHMADVFLLWCRRGVDGFRCDAGYMISVPAWTYITAAVRQQFPDTIFLLEGLGGKISTTRKILDKANLNWAYSELFQEYDRTQIEHYLHEPLTIGKEDGVMIHFAETHDNIRLASQSQTYARMRTSLSALFSQNGGFGFANGVEWFATERIDVHRANSLNWGATENQVELIGRLNMLLKRHPAFYSPVEVSMVQQGGGNCIVLLRHHVSSGKRVLVVVNLDAEGPTRARWHQDAMETAGRPFTDLITEEEIRPIVSDGMHVYDLAPGQVLCLTNDRDELGLMIDSSEDQFALPGRLLSQCLSAKALDVYCFYNGIALFGNFQPDQGARSLAKDPVEYCRGLNAESEASLVITWQWPRDMKRQVMIPPKHFLLVRSEVPFSAQIVDNAGDREFVIAIEKALQCADGSYFALFNPLRSPIEQRAFSMKISIYTADYCEHVTAPLLFLPEADRVRVNRWFNRHELLKKPLLLLGTNNRGGMLRANVSWGKLMSKYDALLAANLNSDFPEDRWIMLSRCRAWVVFQGYSIEVNNDCLEAFGYDDSCRGYWRYHIPCGQGQNVFLTLCMEMAPSENAVRISFFRHKSKRGKGRLADSSEVRIILRPDVEDRNFHETTKAFLGPEQAWPQGVTADHLGFLFHPHPSRVLDVHISEGSFVTEPEWDYMVHRPVEEERGMDSHSDLFSPGYFSAPLKGGHAFFLTAQVMPSVASRREIHWEPLPQDMDAFPSKDKKGRAPADALHGSMETYMVRRKNLSTVIAGYPWFLDWGRDTLIFVRGLIATGRHETARDIIKQFAWFEKDGTIPNMIRGEDADNRDTSDAPLWFFVACSDLINAEKNNSFLDIVCEDRTIRQILISEGRSLVAGTPNGIRMDLESGLIFSPAHFTWMDTNHPAGTPREGYPIEIQALWHLALSFLARIDSQTNKEFWNKKASQVRKSITDLFLLKHEGYLSDCLHAGTHVPAKKAVADDTLRPNQLLAITLGAIVDKEVCVRILKACEELLVPGAIRSLADREVKYPLPVTHHGKILNSPNLPYQGTYKGDEDTRRKPAYHNGTAWTWLFPSFCEAYVKVYGGKGRATALAWLSSGIRHLNEGCVGHMPEILDGDYPHLQRGCDAQAWGESELQRVWLDILQDCHG